jgi:hypothetical protein
LGISADRACDEECETRVANRSYELLTKAFEERISGLKGAGASLLIVDIAGNGGGSEWVQAVARMLSRRELVSQRLGFVRGSHWVQTWTNIGNRLRQLARTESGRDRRRLLRWAAEADAARSEAEKTCPPTGGCPWLGRAGFATGLVGHAPSSEFAGRAWGPLVFSPASFRYRDGIWSGPVIVLVDDATGSAAEEFAAMLQDNGAALILGSRTAGLGCGHTSGGTPTRLTNSGGILHLPDCARFRFDGSNEVQGVIPDQLMAWRPNDGAVSRARMLEAALPRAIDAAVILHRQSPGNVPVPPPS